MKIIFILFALLVGGITTKTVYNEIIDVWYNYEYSLTKLYSSYNKFYFRAEIVKGNKFDIELKMNIYDLDTHYFRVWIYQFTHYPQPSEIINGEGTYYRTDEYGIPYKEDDTHYVLYYRYYYSEYESYFANYLGIIVDYTTDYYHKEFDFSNLAFRLNSNKYFFSNILDYEFNKHYELQVNQLDQHVIPPGYQIYIRSEIFSNDTVEIRLETKENYKKDAFKTDVYQYKDKPVESQVYYGHGYVKCETNIPNDSKEDKKYVYPFKTELDVHHLSIVITNQLNPSTDGSANYLDIFIYSETGMAVALLVVIIVIPSLIVIGVVIFLLKKFGCIGSK